MIRLFTDSRDKLFHQHFGQVTEFADEFNVDSQLQDAIQPIGDVKCTAFTCTEIATDKDKIIYDIDDLFNRIPHDENGAEPRKALGETVKVGLLPKGKEERVKPFSSYWSAHTGQYDSFDNVRSTILISQLPCAVWSAWYANWQGANVLPVGENVTNYHMFSLEGWRQINGEPMLIIEAWVGYKLYMPRATFNDAISKWGCGTAVLSTFEIDEKRKKTIIEALIDAYKNLIILLKAQYLLLKQ